MTIPTRFLQDRALPGRALGLIAAWAIAFATFGRAETPAAFASPDLLPIRFEQRIGATVPLDVALRDDEGTTRPLSAYIAGKPVVLLFGYARCPQL